MLKSRLCDYSDAYILVKGTITFTGAADHYASKRAGERNKGIISKTFALFINCKSEISNTDIYNAKDIDTVMPMYNLIEYSDSYSKTPASLWLYYKDEPNENLAGSTSFKSKVKVTRNTPDDGYMKDVEIIIPSKILSNFWRTIEIPLISCEVNLILTWSSLVLLLTVQVKNDLR